MKKHIISLLLCLVLIITACQGTSNANMEKKEGVYYPKISENTVSEAYTENAFYGYRALYYDGNIYTSFDTVQVLEEDEIDLESFVGEKIGTISTNHEIYWSTDSEKLDEVTGEGVLYKVKGYDEKYRICVYYEISNDRIGISTYNLVFFEHLNDIYLDKGGDLFNDRIKLDESVSLKSKSLQSALTEGTGYSELSMDAIEVREFLKGLYNGKFIDPKDDKYPELKEDGAYSLLFYDSMNLASNILVYKEGYVVKKSGGQIDMVIKVDEKKCADMINLINKQSN